MPKQPFREFVEDELKKTQRMPPEPPSPPKDPGAAATPEEKARADQEAASYREKKKDFDRQMQAWNTALNTRLRSWLWLTKYLSEADAKAGAKPDAPRDFALVLLGIDAWLALAPDGRKDELKKSCEEVSLDQIIEAALELQWTWSAGGEPTRVKRFEIRRREVKQAGDST
jgi:hypothetical protein